ncbi:unnamed protein product [Rotaria magnacalcarata]|uniref:HTH CENPB-type domain-containing protein n=1 Tax=Rotaria magnacalcarata TaxID=392030 RepID=A0A8S2PLQ8_9BILA|nr:unnamed protein product [Rotaria magnacalcarata]
MTIDQSKLSTSNTPFAMIDEHSAIPSEQEILFTMHTVFRVVEMKQTAKNNRLWEVQLTITDDNDPQLSNLTNRIKEEVQGSTGWYRMCKLMLKVGHLDQAEELYQELLKNASTDSDRALIYHQLGCLKDQQGKYSAAVKFYETSLEIKRKTLPENDASLAHTYGNIGGVYDNMGEYSKALSYLEKALGIWRMSLPPTHPNIQTAMNSIAAVKENLQLSEKFNISLGAVSNILKRKGEYTNDYETNRNKKLKRKLKSDTSQEINDNVYEWFVAKRAKSISISGPILQEYARKVAERLDPNFKGSNGWLDRFRTRYNIQFRVICGESRAVDQNIVEDWKTRLISMIEHYDPENIYNCDETGLFYKLMPDRSMTIDRIDSKGGKKSKERYTVMLCSNWTGSNKLKPVVIVKHIIANATTAMTADDVNITALDAVYWIQSAWEMVTSTTIKNTFKSAGFGKLNVVDEHDLAQVSSIANEDTVDSDTPIEDLDRLLKLLSIGGKFMSANEYVSFDDDVPSFNEWNDSADKLLVIKGITSDDNDNSEDTPSEDIPSEDPPSLSESLDLVRRLHLLSTTQHPELHPYIIQLQSKLTDVFLNSNQSKQRSILDYFNILPMELAENPKR